jgi:hypothetical protein
MRPSMKISSTIQAVFGALLCVSALSIAPSSSQAIETDYGITGVARMNTPAALVDFQAGASNGYRAQLEFYPISLIGLNVGTQGLHRLVDAPSIDCESYECGGWVQSHFIQARAVIGAGKFFGQVLFHRDFYLERKNVNRPIFDPVTLLPLLGDDRSDSWTGLAGYTFTPEWSAGLLYMSAKASLSEGKAEHMAAFARWKPSEFTYTLALGRANSTVNGVGPQALFMFGWWPKPKVGL